MKEKIILMNNKYGEFFNLISFSVIALFFDDMKKSHCLWDKFIVEGIKKK